MNDMTPIASNIETPSDVILRVSAATGVPVVEIAGDSLRQEALEARMMVAWLCARAKRWRLREVSVSLNRSYDAVKRLVRSAERSWSRNHDWGILASAILREVERKSKLELALEARAEAPARKPRPPQTARVGTRLKLNRPVQLPLRLGDRPQVAVPPSPPAKPKPLSANSKHGPPVHADEDVSFGLQDNTRRNFINMDNAFKAAMLAAGERLRRIGPNGEELPVEAA